MRKFLLSLLLASAAATPALADPRNRSDASDARAERQQAREARQESRSEQSGPRDQSVGRGDRGDGPRVDTGRVERGGNEGGGRPDVATPSHGAADAPVNANAAGAHFVPGTSAAARAADVEARRTARTEHLDTAPAARALRMEDHVRINNSRTAEARNQARSDRAESRNVRQVARQDAREDRQDTTQWRRLGQGDTGGPRVVSNKPAVVSRVPRAGTQPPVPTEARPASSTKHWDSNWRHDSKYNWYNWRKRHHSLFNLGFYYDPFGWGYRRYSIGWRLWPSYYSSNYWLSDPWEYRLPYAPPGYRWIRYYDDAVLIDTWDGRIVDVIYNFFW